MNYKTPILVILTLISIPLFLVLNSVNELDRTNTGTYCDKIENYDLKEVCLALLEKNFSRCEKLSYLDTLCYKNLIDTNNVSLELCQSLSRYEASSRCFLKLAIQTGDSSYCNETGGKYFFCKWIMAYELNDSSLCNEVDTDCKKYRCLAFLTGNESLCNEVIEEDEKKICLALTTNNFTKDSCGIYSREYGEVLYAPVCLYSISFWKKDVSVCQDIEHNQIKWECYARFENETLCNYAENQFFKEFCLVEIFKNTMLPTYYKQLDIKEFMLINSI